MSQKSKNPKIPKRTDAEKKAKLVELATKRATMAIKAIRRLCNLNGSNYIYTSDQIKKIADSLYNETNNMVKKFDHKQPKSDIDLGL